MDQPFTYRIEANRSASIYLAGNCPAGLSADENSGVISGTPTQAGHFAVLLSANSAYGTATATLDLTISSDAPVATVSASPSMVMADGVQTAAVRFTLSHAVPRDTFLFFRLTGATAIEGDTKITQNSVDIPAGKTHQAVKVRPAPGQAIASGVSNVQIFKVTLSSPGDHTYIVGAPKSAKIKVVSP